MGVSYSSSRGDVFIDFTNLRGWKWNLSEKRRGSSLFRQIVPHPSLVVPPVPGSK
ncbi:hypothetical protein QJS04_geneDACA006862 [Acorus gramineus]|uniref:Uncharacterized protein n=1 Tax=Acorus gramineus TaxID=55184 RepID=A0AAV9B090_ACOGR|nr:hypothetical protein QJS04_geneDACA006862 [Acorus gramineus]